MNKTPSLAIEEAHILCQLCKEPFWFKWSNEWQSCPHCGAKNWKKAIFKEDTGLNGKQG